MLRLLYLLGGLTSLSLGILGAFLPLLPTTPFLLLSSYCFARSSPRLQRWLLNHPWLGPYVRDWEEHRGVRRSVKVVAVLTVLLVVASIWLLGERSLTIRWAVTGFASIGLLVVWRLPVVPVTPPQPVAVGSEDPAPVDLVA